MKVVGLLIVCVINVFLVNGQTRWDSMMAIYYDVRCYTVHIELYKNHKRINLLDGKSEWFLVSDKEGKRDVSKTMMYSENNFFRLCKSRSKEENLSLILKRKNQFYDFPLNDLDTIHRVWAYVKHVDNMWSRCFWDTRRELKESLYKKGYDLESLKRRNRIGIYDKFWQISFESDPSWTKTVDYIFPLTIYTKKEYRQKNKDLKALIMENTNYDKKSSARKRDEKKRKCYYEGISIEINIINE